MKYTLTIWAYNENLKAYFNFGAFVGDQIRLIKLAAKLKNYHTVIKRG
jgi:hypothetical protein